MPSSEPAVSVIMIFRDAGRYIDQAIRSVEAQTFTDWELVLVDDGSTDDGPDIVARNQSRLGERLRLLRHPGGGGRGTGPSRNLGMQAARGRYLAFLDGDDVYEPLRLQRHVQYLERDPGLGIVISAERYWRTWQPAVQGRAGEYDSAIGPTVTPERPIEAPALIVATLLTRGAPLASTGSITFRAAAIGRLGAIPDEFTGHYEDQVLICKLLLDNRAVVLDECLSRYRQHPASLTQANAPMEQLRGSSAWAARRRFLEWLGPYARSRGVLLSELDAWIRDELGQLDSPMLEQRRGAMPQVLSFVGRAATRTLPGPLAAALGQWRHTLQQRRLRRRVMRKVHRYERQGPALDRAIRAYWNDRIHDTPLSDDAPGTAGFYAALDTYRLRKNRYLAHLMDYRAWAGKDVLDVGSGAGLDLVRFARGRARVTGVDVSEMALALARGACEAAGVNAMLIEADGARLPFPDASFDLVYSHGVLSFVRDPAAVVGEACRVLRPGGQAILMVYNQRSWMHWLLRIPGWPVNQGHADAPGFRSYTRAEFDRLLSPFEVTSVRMERPPPVRLLPQALSDRWLRPLGWHMLAFCRKRA